MRRTRRWAQTRFSELATRNGSMPMFIRRLMVLGASLVCRVDSTRWPVSAAFTAISAVSKSRISPTRMMFGSWRRKLRSAAAKLRPMALAHLDLVDADEVELDRVLGGHDVGLGRVDPRDRRVERVGLAAAGRPGDQHHAPRLADLRLELAQRLRLEAQLRHVEHQLGAVEQTHDDLLAEERRQARDAEVDVALRRPRPRSGS